MGIRKRSTESTELRNGAHEGEGLVLGISNLGLVLGVIEWIRTGR